MTKGQPFPRGWPLRSAPKLAVSRGDESPLTGPSDIEHTARAAPRAIRGRNVPLCHARSRFSARYVLKCHVSALECHVSDPKTRQPQIDRVPQESILNRSTL